MSSNKTTGDGRGTRQLIIERMKQEHWREVEQIYLEGILEGEATFEVESPGWEVWDSSHTRCCRFVALRDGRVVGWAALSPVSSRACYRGVAEVSVYVSRSERGRGIGNGLLNRLIEESEREGYWTLQGVTFIENKASLRLQERCGFRIVGRREDIAQHHGRWRTTVLMERRSARVGNPECR